MIEGIVIIIVAVVFFAVGRLYERRKAQKGRDELYEELEEESLIERLEAKSPLQASFKSKAKPIGDPEEQVGSGDVVTATEVPKDKGQCIGGQDAYDAVTYYGEWNSCQKEAARKLGEAKGSKSEEREVEV